MPNESFKDEVLELALELAWSLWAELGVSGWTRRAQRTANATRNPLGSAASRSLKPFSAISLLPITRYATPSVARQPQHHTHGTTDRIKRIPGDR